MARITRKDLKTDKFALEVEHTVDYFEEHRSDIIRYTIAAAIVLALIFGFLAWGRHQHAVREEALNHAIRAQEASVGGAAPGGALSFPTQQAKDAEVTKRFTEVATKYSGSDEGWIAEYYLGSMAADQGRLPEAEKRLRSVADSGSKVYASLAKFSLAQLLLAENRPQEAQNLLRDLVNNPTIMVSKEQATMVLARSLAKTNPAEARKLLDPLRASRSEVSQAAIQLYSELPAK